jgi:hypothetical protein
MARIPRKVRIVLDHCEQEFTPSVWNRFFAIFLVAILLRGRRTILRIHDLAERLVPGHFSSLHRVFSHRRWRASSLARVLARGLVDHFASNGTLEIVGDDTVSQHRGENVYGKACHRDAVRSAHGHLVHRWGHKWVVLALRVRVPGAARTWALPVLVALYRTPELNAQEGRRHKTPAELMQGLLAVWMRWFPGRKSVFAGDGAFCTHKLTRFAQRHRRRLCLVSKFYPDAVLHQLPPRRRKGQKGRNKVRGNRLPTPGQVAKSSKRWQKLFVAWYGGGRRHIEVVSRVGHWYRQGHGLVQVRWVNVRDLTGSHRDECLMSTDETLSVREIVESFVGRWDIEVMYEEMREHLGLEKTRGRCKQTVLRVEPCLFGLYSLIAFWFACLPGDPLNRIVVTWPGKQSITFSDAIATVRREAWAIYINQTTILGGVVDKLTRRQQHSLWDILALAA